MAVSRTPNAIGRISRLIVSIMTSTGTKRSGVLSGRRWPSACVGWLVIPIITVAIQRGAASPRLRDSWVVGVKVYGSRPSTFNVTRKTIKDVNRAAHSWALGLRGSKSCCVKRLIKQLCNVM